MKVQRLSKREQKRVLEKIARLTAAGLQHKDISQKLVKHGTANEKSIGKYCLETIGEGKNLTHGISPWLSKNAALSLFSGESTGNFELGLRDAIAALDIEEASSGTIAKSLFKPLLGLVGFLFFSALVAHYAYPMLEVQLAPARWPSISLFYRGFGLFWWEFGTWFLFLLIIAGSGIALSLNRYVSSWRKQLDNLPIYRHYRLIQCTNLLTSMAGQTAANIGLKESLKHVQSSASPYLGNHISLMLKKIGAGKTNVGDIFDTGLLMHEELDTLRLLGSIGQISLTLKKSADIHRSILILELNQLNVIGKYVFYTTAAVLGGGSMLGVGILAFYISTTYNF